MEERESDLTLGGFFEGEDSAGVSSNFFWDLDRDFFTSFPLEVFFFFSSRYNLIMKIL